MNDEIQKALAYSKSLMMKVGCSEVEADLLLQAALDSPPRGASPVEAVQALGLAFTMNPNIREGLLDLAALHKFDRERAQEIAAFEREQMARFNVGFPYCAAEFFDALRHLIKGLWPHVHESCLDGAIMVGVIELQDRWTLNPFAMVKCMRETREADRSMRYGYGR